MIRSSGVLHFVIRMVPWLSWAAPPASQLSPICCQLVEDYLSQRCLLLIASLFSHLLW